MLGRPFAHFFRTVANLIVRLNKVIHFPYGRLLIWLLPRTWELQVNVATKDAQQLWIYKGKRFKAKYWNIDASTDYCPALRSTALKDIHKCYISFWAIMMEFFSNLFFYKFLVDNLWRVLTSEFWIKDAY